MPEHLTPRRNRTIRQTKLIKLLMENYGKKGETKPLGEIMIEAGYSEESAKNPKLFLDSPVIKEGIDDFVKMLDDKRRLAITHITKKKLEKSSARDNAYIADVFTKNHQLLTGKATEMVKTIALPSELIEKNAINTSTETNSD